MGFFSGKVIWLTGASSGIGEALTLELAHSGAKLIISARRKEELERVKGRCKPAAQSNIEILPFDLKQPEMLHLSSQAAIQIFGHIDIFINNAGIAQRSLAKETLVAVDREIMEVDYFAPLSICKYLLPHFLKRRYGHFVIVSSVMGKMGTPYRSGYAGAKHALHGFFDSLRAELWKESKKIKVTLICPGWVKTNFTINALTGNGSKLNQMDPSTSKGMNPYVFARKMMAAIESGKKEVYIGGLKEKTGVYLMRYFPRVFARVIRKIKVR